MSGLMALMLSNCVKISLIPSSAKPSCFTGTMTSLVIDCDKQGNLTRLLRCLTDGFTLTDVLLQKCSATEAIIKTAYENLDIIPVLHIRTFCLFWQHHVGIDADTAICVSFLLLWPCDKHSPYKLVSFIPPFLQIRRNRQNTLL